MDKWKVTETSEYFAQKAGLTLPPMTQSEIDETVEFLRTNGYPMPADCPGQGGCPKYRPACILGICRVAVGLCGDF